MNNHIYNPGPDFQFPTSLPPPTSTTETQYQDAATAFASSSSTCFNIPESKDHHHQQNPRKKRSKLMRQDNDNPTKRPKCVKKPDPSAPKITKPCSECGRKFWSWKALFGHMRCHPERQWRGIDPPPDLRRTVSPNRVVTELEFSMSEEDHEAASSLLILASGSDQTQVAGTSWQGVGENDSGGRFECSSCKKVFGSHQALGGHRASHKNVKGCFAITKTDVEVDQNHHPNGAAGHGYGGVGEHNVDDVMEENKMVMVLDSAHQCSICWRVFSSGQALGGHKRCHLEKGEEESVVMTQLGLSNNTNSGGLDLNLPASAATATATTVEDDRSSSYSSAGLALDLSSSKSITKFSMMVEDDKPPTILPKPNSEEPNSAGVTSTPLTFTEGEKYLTCGICLKEHGPLCSYFDYVPPGATVGPGYSVICHRCCHYLSMPSWICNNCGGKIRAGKVIIKHCIICKSNYQHETADCPHDEDKAAECRWIKEVDRSKKYTPYFPKYVPRTPIPKELW